MKNLIKTIKCNIHHCLHDFRSFNRKQARGTRHLLDAVFPQRSLVLLLFIMLIPIYSIVAQNQKAIKTHLRESEVFLTPQFAGSNSVIKPTIVRSSVSSTEQNSLTIREIQYSNNSSPRLTWPQLSVQISAGRQTFSDVTVYAGSYDQRAPQIVSDGSEMYVAFENSSTVGGSYPYGDIDVYKSIDGGTTWTSWKGVYDPGFRLSSPQIVLIGGDVVMSYQSSNGYLYTARCLRKGGLFYFQKVPCPLSSTSEYIVAHRMISDIEVPSSYPWLYMAYLFKQADGNNKVLYSYSPDTASSWGILSSSTYWEMYYDSLGLSQTELGKDCIGFDYGISGLYISYLGTGANDHNVIMIKSTNWGQNWSSEQILPNTGTKHKVGPVVAVSGQRVAVVYQYDYSGAASDWKTSSDFDIEAVVSTDEGTSWKWRSVANTNQNEILPWVTHDADSSFYVSFIRDDKTRLSSAGDEIAFSAADSSSTNTSSSDDFPSVFGSNISGEKKAFTTWAGISDGLDVFGAMVALRVPPLSPTYLSATSVSSSQINLAWNDNSTDETGFTIYSRAGGTSGTWSKLTTAPANTTSSASYDATGLIPSTQYDFFVCAFNANGNSLITNIATDTTRPGVSGPAAPTNLKALPVNTNRIDISWQDNATDEDGFRIDRKTGAAGTYTEITTVGINATSYQDNTVSVNTPYYYRVRAYNSTGLSAYSNEANATTSPVVTPPAAPQNLTGIIGNGKVALRWNKNTESDFLRYRIYSGKSPNPTTEIDSTSGGITDTVKVISGLTNGTTYYFRIKAVNNTGLESGFSNEVNKVPNIVVDNTPPYFTVSPYVTGVPVYVNAIGSVVSNPLPHVLASANDDESGMLEMQVLYRNNMEKQWSPSPKFSGGTIDYQIPASSFSYNNKPIGVNFRVVARNNADSVKWSPYYSIDVRLGPQVTDQSNLTMPAASQLSSKATAYRMISVPYDLLNKQPADLLSSFGDHKENSVPYARWRFQRYANGQYQDYDKFSTEDAVTPGAAFFFIVRDQISQIAAKGASVVRSDNLYNTDIQLKNGWNLIGNPFTVSYPVDSLEFINTLMIGRAYYSGSSATGTVGGWEMAGANVAFIQPWQGIAIKVNNDGTMKFPSVGQRSGLPKQNVTPSIERREPTQAENPSNWMISINAYRSDIDMRCDGGAVGMAQGANEGDDQYDLYIPPFVGDKNIAVYFNNSDGAMLRDIRPLNDEGGVWEMHVVTGDAGARVKLQLGDELNLPNPAFEAYLIDTDQKMAHNLKEIKLLEINSGNGVRNFRVVVGEKSFVTQNNAGVELTPSIMRLFANYPNPFNPETVIRYTVPEASVSYKVMLKIFNVLGQEIATLVNEQKSAGYYEVKWNALQQSSGVYFYQLSITDGSKTFRDIKKMVLMK